MRAASLGSYPSLLITARTRAAVLALTRSPPFTTRETVMVPTPQARATSARVGLADRLLGISPPFTIRGVERNRLRYLKVSGKSFFGRFFLDNAHAQHLYIRPMVTIPKSSVPVNEEGR